MASTRLKTAAKGYESLVGKNEFDRYKEYIKRAQTYAKTQQAKDPAYKAWLQESQRYTADMGPGPAWTGKDYYSEYFKKVLPKDLQADYKVAYDSVKADEKKSLKGRIGQGLKIGVPLAVGAAGLAATGALGAGAQAFVGGAPLSTTGAAAGELVGSIGQGINSANYAAIPASGDAAAAATAKAVAAAGGSSTAAGKALIDAYVGAGAGAGAGTGAGTGAGKGLTTAADKVLTGAGKVLTGGSGGGGSGGGGSGKTTTGKVTDEQEDLVDDMDEALREQLGFNKEQFEFYKKITGDQYQLGLDALNWNKELAQDAKDRAARFDELYFDTTGRQLRQLSEDVDNYNAPAEGLRMSGRAVADVESQMDNARGSYLRGLTSRGWNPNSGALQASLSDMELQGALAKSSASTMAYEAAKREGLNLRAMAAGLGQPNANVATANTGLSGELNTSGLSTSTQALMPSFTNLGLYNQGQNTAIGWGNAANSGYNNMRTGNSSWSDNLNYGNALLGGLRGYATNGIWGGLAGAAGGLLGG